MDSEAGAHHVSRAETEASHHRSTLLISVYARNNNMTVNKVLTRVLLLKAPAHRAAEVSCDDGSPG